jgi:broad specificity phosphatase PhoE
MSLLTLVRHGQASYMAKNYDKLSPVGERQARKLGEFWLKTGTTFDLVFQGPAERHARTATIVAEVFKEAGRPWPQPVTIPGVDEFDAGLLMRLLVPILAERHEPVREMQEAFVRGADTPEAGLLLQRLFEEVARHWSSGTADVPEMESWSAFRTRICSGIRQIRSLAPKSSSSVVFTSGGPIAATIAIAQDLSPRKAIELVWVSRNSSYSEFLFSGDRFSLSSFNAHPHIEDRALLTYR